MRSSRVTVAPESPDDIPTAIGRLAAVGRVGQLRGKLSAIASFAPVARERIPDDFPRLETVGPNPIVHRPPRVALVVNGIEIQPREIGQYDGQPLHFLPDRSDPVNGPLLAFTKLADVHAELKKHPDDADLPAISASVVGPPPEGLALFLDVNYGGDRLDFQYSDCARELPRCHRGFLGTGGNWNDVASSLMNSGPTATLYEHTNYAGSSFTAIRGSLFPWLGQYGFNDRISSVSRGGAVQNICWPWYWPGSGC